MIFGFNSYICVKKQKLLNKDNPNVSCIYKYIYYTFTDKKKDYQPWFQILKSFLKHDGI